MFEKQEDFDQAIADRVQQEVINAMQKESSGFNLPSFADILGVDTESPILNWHGIFGGQNQLNIDPMQMQIARANQERMLRMTGMYMNALNFMNPLFQVIRGAPPETVRQIRGEMAAENTLRGSPTSEIVDQIARGLWLHGRGTYPQTGETFANSRVRVGNLGEPHGLSLTADKGLLERSFAKHTEDTMFLPEGYEIKELTPNNYQLKSPKGTTLGYGTSKSALTKHAWKTKGIKTDEPPPFARVFPKFGGVPSEKVLPAWVAPGTEWSQKIIKDAYIESLPSDLKNELLDTIQIMEHKAIQGKSSYKDFLKDDASWRIKDAFQGYGGDFIEKFNKRISQNLQKKGYKALLYSPERYNEYEMRMLNPDDVVMLDMRKQTDPALQRMYSLPDTDPHISYENKKSAGRGSQLKKMRKLKEQASGREGASLRDIYSTITWDDIDRVLNKK